MTEQAGRDDAGPGDDSPVLDRDQLAEAWGVPPEVVEEDEAGCE